MTFAAVWLKWWSDANAGKSTQRVGMYLGAYAAFEVTALVFLGLMIWYGIIPCLFSLLSLTCVGTASPP